MSIKKIGENLNFDLDQSLLSPKQALVNDEITKRFIKLAKKLRRVAPKAQDFLYGSCIMMHSAESSLIDQKTGSPIKNDKGNPIEGHFEPIKVHGKESVKWVSKDGIKPYKNQNGDIFSECELLKAHKKWIGKPLCKDHKSESVDGIRGIIVDTYYDSKFKRVHALFALDRKNYSDLARKVETGYANSVSMGTAVGRAVCTECGNVATTEKDYCKCIKSRSNYGEINLDLSPIELSLVVNGADHLAKIRNIVASVNDYVQKKQERVEQLVNDRCVNPTELQSLADSVNEIQIKLNNLMSLQKTAETKTASDLGEISKAIEVLQEQVDREEDPERQQVLKDKIDNFINELTGDKEEPKSEDLKVWPQATMGGGPSFSTMSDQDTAQPAPGSLNPSSRYANIEGDSKKQGTKEISLLRSKVETLQNSLKELKQTFSKEEKNMNSARLRARAKTRRAYWLGTEEPKPGKEQYPKEDAESIRTKEDKQMTGVVETGSDGLFPGDEQKLKEVGRDGLTLKKSELEDRKMKRRAYFLGGGGLNEPTPGKEKYPKEDAESTRTKEDKQMTGLYDMGKTDGIVPADKAVKEKMLRAKLRAKFTKVADDKGGLRKDASHWDIYAGDEMILSASGSEIYGDELDSNWDYLSSAEYGKDVMKYLRTDGFDRVAFLLKGAQDPAVTLPPAPGGELPPAAPAPAPAPAAAEEPKKDKNQEKINTALNAVEEKIEELRELCSGGSGLVDVDVDVSKKEPGLGKLDELTASVLTLLDESADELALASEALEKSAVDEKLLEAIGQALRDNETIMAQASLVVDAKKKKEKKDKKEDKKEEKEEKKEDKEEKKEFPFMKKEDKEEKEDKKEKKAQELLDKALKVRAANRAALLATATECEKCGEESAEDHACMADDMAMMVEEDMADVCAARKLDREGLVAQAADKLQYPTIHDKPLTLDKAENTTEPTFFQAHPKGGTVTELTGTKTPEAKVETIEEVHEIMRDVAESQPRNVREAAAVLQEKIVEGAVKAADLDKLVAEGKVDSETVSYWKKYFAQAPGSGSFGADLSKEFAGKKKEASDEAVLVKLRRAYDVGLQAQEKGIINSTRASLDNYVDEILQFDDASFESNKRIIASYNSASAKQVGKMPIVGTNAAAEPMNVTASTNPTAEPTILDGLASLGWK